VTRLPLRFADALGRRRQPNGAWNGSAVRERNVIAVTGDDGRIGYISHTRARIADNLFWRHHVSPAARCRDRLARTRRRRSAIRAEATSSVCGTVRSSALAVLRLPRDPTCQPLGASCNPFAPPRDDFLLGLKPAYMSEGPKTSLVSRRGTSNACRLVGWQMVVGGAPRGPNAHYAGMNTDDSIK
jgi:hypothetical protein